VLSRLRSAAALRRATGYDRVSHRLCFGEADGLPGLVIDRYLLAEKQPAQVFVVQAHTAGIDRMLPAILEALEALVKAEHSPAPLARTAIVLRNDVGVRKLEGVEEEGPRVAREVQGLDLAASRILVRPAAGGKPIVFRADLIEGQKTGFFLDQTQNVATWASLWKPQGPKVRILDLCCYAGQWGAQLARAYIIEQGLDVEVTGVDASKDALELARANVEAQGAKFAAMQGDVLEDLVKLKDASFDIVISDPPALIKGRKAIPAGTHAYLQLNTQVFRIVAPGGGVVCCSCSALLEEEKFLQQLSKAAYRNRRNVRWFGRGSQAPDHPVTAEFPEGRYLKCFFGGVE